jgi:hypothetical protein
MATPTRPDLLRDFLDGTDTPEVDLGGWLLHLMAHDALIELGGGVLADAVALRAPYACAPLRCTPGLRERRHRSCCADLEVTPTGDERARIEAIADDPGLADDPRWVDGPPALFEAAGALTRPGRRCVFARAGAGGALHCGLHALEDARGWPRGHVKPLPCRLFPLVVVAIDDERVLLTAVHRRTARALGTRPAAAFPCLHAAEAPSVAVSERETIEALFGKRAWSRLARALSDPAAAPSKHG